MSNDYSSLLESLADLEHEQWMHWSEYVAENHDIPEELRSKWEKSWKPYSDLSEDMKDKDRKWAKKAINRFEEEVEDVATEIAEDEENVSEEMWKGALLFKEKMMQRIDTDE